MLTKRDLSGMYGVIFTVVSFFERANLLFDEDIRFAEDSPFNLSAFREAERVKMLDEGLYIYRENPNSLTEIPYKPAMDEHLQKTISG